MNKNFGPPLTPPLTLSIFLDFMEDNGRKWKSKLVIFVGFIWKIYLPLTCLFTVSPFYIVTMVSVCSGFRPFWHKNTCSHEIIIYETRISERESCICIIFILSARNKILDKFVHFNDYVHIFQCTFLVCCVTV